MDTKKLRQKILDLAIRGRLVPQDPNDEPTSVLLERIRAEKERLIKEGKIKRSKKSASDTPHYENVPFEVPEGWEWTTLGELCSFLSRGKSPKYSEERKYPVFAQKCNLYDGDISLEKARFLDPETISKWSDEYKLIDGDILVNSTGTGTVGRTRLFHSDVLGDYPFVVPDSHVSVIRSFEEIESKFVWAFLSSDYGQTYIEDNLAGSTNQKELYIGVLDNMQFPLPPHEEQFRIVTTVDKWFTLIDTLESAKEDLQTSIAQAKSKILDLAIHGKLVPQDPNDEPAIELLKRINPKFTPCDNAHYENVPTNWTAILLGDLCFTINGLWKGKKPPFVNVGVIRNANFTKDCKLDYSNIAYLEVEAKQYEKRKLQYGDIIVEKSGGSDNQPVGRTILFEKTEGEYSFSNFTSVLRIYDGYPALPEYLNMYLQAVYQTGITKRMQTQTTGIHNLIFDQFLAIPIKLPPLAEQRRIINKVSELSQILDNISAEL